MGFLTDGRKLLSGSLTGGWTARGEILSFFFFFPLPKRKRWLLTHPWHGFFSPPLQLLDESYSESLTLSRGPAPIGPSIRFQKVAAMPI